MFGPSVNREMRLGEEHRTGDTLRLELVKAFEKASGRPVPYEIVARRPGDVDACYADPTYAHEQLGWQARRDLDAMCTDSWRWQHMNPAGFDATA